MASNIYIVQDGDTVKPEIKSLFSDLLEHKDFIVNQDIERYNFVGFIFGEEKTLISFPKHTYPSDKLSELKLDHSLLMKQIRILFNCIKRAASNRSNRYAGVKKELNSDYPFLDFLEVYRYYQQYGLFTNEKEVKKFGLNGRISWKDTMNKSPKVIQHQNLVFIPLIVREKIDQYVFISKCMAYVIDSTLQRFSLFLEGHPTNLDTRDIDFSNTSLVISQLRKVKRTLFKNVHQRLVDALISFFEREKNKGGNYQLKIYSFHLVWEDMVQAYLRTRFKGINEQLEIEWADEVVNIPFNKRTFYPDIRGVKGYSIEPDFYLVSDNTRYIFDAKYYQTLSELDYKQIAYYFLLKHYGVKRKANGKVQELETYNALILPTENANYHEVHFELNPEYNANENKFSIIAYYLNTLHLMKCYTNT